MIHFVNAAMIPNYGRYEYYPLSRSEFREYAMKITACHPWKSSIGYQTTAKILSEILGFNMPMNREKTSVQKGDTMLVCKLKYRVQNPHEKADNTHGQNIEDYEFGRIQVLEAFGQEKENLPIETLINCHYCGGKNVIGHLELNSYRCSECDSL